MIGKRYPQIVASVLAAGVLVIGAALWLERDSSRRMAAAAAPSVTPPARPPAPAAPPAPLESAPGEVVETAPADLPQVCAALDEDQLGLPTQACMDALEAHFLPRPASRTILPVSPPLVWSDVFQGLGPKIEAVAAALEDAACEVPEGEIRPELGGRCAARTMAELNVLREVCSMAGRRAVDPHISLSPRGFGLHALNVVEWERVDRRPYRTNVNAATRTRALDRWAEQAPDQAAWAAGERRLDDLYYRTAWKRARCSASGPMLDWIGGERWDGLLARAARLGDAFALAHHLGSAEHAARLAELDAPLGHLHLASLGLRSVREAWREEDSEAGWSIAREQHQDRVRLLKMAGIDCGDCTVKAVDRAFHYTYDYHFRQCEDVKCPNLEAMRELDAALMRPFTERGLTRPARSLPHRRRAEAVALKYALAVRSLAEAAGVAVDASLLRHLAAPDAPALLTPDEVEQARHEAERLVAGAL